MPPKCTFRKFLGDYTEVRLSQKSVNPFMPPLYIEQSFSNLRVMGSILQVLPNFKSTFFIKQKVQKAASGLALHCLPMSHKMDARLIRVNNMHTCRRPNAFHFLIKL